MTLYICFRMLIYRLFIHICFGMLRNVNLLTSQAQTCTTRQILARLQPYIFDSKIKK